MYYFFFTKKRRTAGGQPLLRGRPDKYARSRTRKVRFVALRHACLHYSAVLRFLICRRRRTGSPSVCYLYTYVSAVNRGRISGINISLPCPSHPPPPNTHMYGAYSEKPISNPENRTGVTGGRGGECIDFSRVGSSGRISRPPYGGEAGDSSELW